MDPGINSLRNAVIENLQQMNFQSIQPLGKGAIGEVLSATSEKHGKVAVKIIRSELYWHMEEEVWPLLRHENILPVLDIVRLEMLNVQLYVMPLHPTALLYKVQSAQFLSDSTGLVKIRQWLREILSALKYMHDLGYCHLDIKTDNVLISSEEHAILCDFTGVNRTDVPVHRLCAPAFYKPPECHDARLAAGVSGTAFDVWTLGLLSLNVLTSHSVQRNLPKGEWTWAKNMRPLFAKCLETTTFTDLMKISLRSVPLEQQDIDDARNFILHMLKMGPEERPCVEEIMRHPFLKSNQHLESGDSLPEDVLQTQASDADQSLFNVAAEIKCDTKEVTEKCGNLTKDICPAMNTYTINVADEFHCFSEEVPERQGQHVSSEVKNDAAETVTQDMNFEKDICPAMNTETFQVDDEFQCVSEHVPERQRKNLAQDDKNDQTEVATQDINVDKDSCPAMNTNTVQVADEFQCLSEDVAMRQGQNLAADVKSKATEVSTQGINSEKDFYSAMNTYTVADEFQSKAATKPHSGFQDTKNCHLIPSLAARVALGINLQQARYRGACAPALNREFMELGSNICLVDKEVKQVPMKKGFRKTSSATGKAIKGWFKEKIDKILYRSPKYVKF